MEENYDDMSNDQLRLKLLEYGFTNMPVTSTTRKVLIKKLKNHVSNGTTIGKVRRETIHVTKYSSDEDTEPTAVSSQKKTLTKKELTNRRATIGGASAKLVKAVSSSHQASKVTAVTPGPEAAISLSQPEPALASKRRSGRITPVKGKSSTDSQAKAVPPQEPAIMEDSDDDMIPLKQFQQRDRKSKSPSLSRADMLTTSYVHQMEVSKAPTVESVVEEMEVDVPELYKNEEQIETIILDDYDEVESYSMPPPQQLSQPKPVVKESFYSKTASQLNSRRTVDGRKLNELPLMEAPSEEKDAPRPVPNIITSSRMSMATTLRDETGPKCEPSDSPYLSEFTKRLSRLRADGVQQPRGVTVRESPRRTLIQEKGLVDNPASLRPAYASKNAYEASTSRYRPSERYTFAPPSTGYGPLRKKTGDIRASFRQSLLMLDQKYSIMKKFYCVIIVLVVVFLFVFFFM